MPLLRGCNAIFFLLCTLLVILPRNGLCSRHKDNSTPSTWSKSRNGHDGSQVWRLDSNNRKGLQWLQSMEEQLCRKYKLDFWRPPRLHHPVDIMIQRKYLGQFKTLLTTHNITYTVMIEDVGMMINQQLNAMKGRKNVTNLEDFDYAVYHPCDEIRKWVTDFATEHSDIVQEVLIGTSYEGREISGLKISVNSSVPKKSVWFEGGIHAREWISPATVMYITNQLVTDYNNGDATVQTIFNNLDFYIVPSLNVDGYAYTWTLLGRLWRKTRSPNKGSLCIGTDANRNWPYKWGGAGASPSPCSETYRGTNALSEVEMQAVTNYALARAQEQEFIVFIDWHSYSQLWMHPWSYSSTADPPKDVDDLSALGKAAVDAIKSVHGKIYTPGGSAQISYEAAGSSEDWGYAGLGAKYSYVVELRDTGRYGFLLPEDQIVPTGEECYAAVKVVGQWVVDEMDSNR